MKTYALLIGLNQYKDSRIPTLTGCVNDINRFETYLKKQLGVDAKNITKLTDKQVTKKAVVAAFEKHIGLVGSADNFIFYFAGHGIRQYANNVLKADALNDAMECLTCHDTVLEGQNLIADKEMRWLINRLYETSKGGEPNGAHIVTLFDCCHSGDNTRDIHNKVPPAVERCVRDRGREYIMPQRSWKEFIFANDITEADFKDNEIGSLFPQGKHVSLAACAANETAKEDRVANHGYFSTFLLETLESTNGKVSYYDLRSLMSRRLDKLEFETRQTPQFYAVDTTLFQPFLGGPADTRVKTSVIFSQERSRWEMTMGSIYGITEGAKIFVDLGNGQSEAAVVKQVMLDYSVLDFEIEPLETNKPEDKKRIKRSLNYSALVDKFQQKDIKVACVDKKSAAAWDKFCKAKPDLLDLARAKVVAANPDYVINTEGGQIFIAHPSAPARPLVEMLNFKKPEEGFIEITKQLRAISRWEFVRQQKTEPAADKLFENLTISMTNSKGSTDVLKNPKVICEMLNYTTKVENDLFKMDESLSIKITNNGGTPIYIAGIWLSEFFEINVKAVNENSIAVPLQPAKSFYVHKETFRLTFRNNVFVDKWDKFSNFIKIYAAAAPFEIAQLQQTELEAPRIGSFRSKQVDRGVGDDDEAMSDPQWAVKTIELVLDTSKIV